MMDYCSYSYSPREYFLQWIKGVVLSAILFYLFYDSILIMIAGGSIFGIFYAKRQKKALIEERKWQLNLQFKEGISGISTALQAGYSMENSFEEARKNLQVLYRGESMIEEEFAHIQRQLALNHTLEELLENLGIRSGVEDIISFAEVFSIAKRTGGDMVQIIRSTVKNMNEKLVVKREIQTMVAGKKMEGKIMTVIPPFMIAYLRVTSPGFLNPLYHNLPGVLLMTGMFLLYFLAYLAEEKIMNMEV